MSIFSTIHRNTIWPLVEHRNNIKTKKNLLFLSKSEKWSRDEILYYQSKRLKNILRHAYENTLFYKDRFDNLGLKPDDIRSLEDYKQIPSVTRNDLNNYLDKMIALNISEKDRYFSTTGGSTGIATRFAIDNKCLDIKKASEYRFNIWTGWNPGEKILAYWPALTDFDDNANQQVTLRNLLYSRHLKLFSGRLNKKILSEHLEAYIRFKPSLIRAFPSALQKFAEYIKSEGNNLLQPKAIICVGEPLLESQRILFKNVFGCDVYNCYVSRECGNIACECPAHEGLHIAEEMIYLEIENQGEDGFGKILLTDLWNMGMPFIRYEIQDAARFVKGDCSCGKKHRRIGVDAARLSDFLISPVDGSYVSGSTLIHYLLAEGPQVGRVKLVQDANDHITILMTGDEKSNRKSVDHIKTRLNTVFKGKMKLHFKYVDNIPLLKSGKYSFVERKFS